MGSISRFPYWTGTIPNLLLRREGKIMIVLILLFITFLLGSSIGFVAGVATLTYEQYLENKNDLKGGE